MTYRKLTSSLVSLTAVAALGTFPFASAEELQSKETPIEEIVSVAIDPDAGVKNAYRELEQVFEELCAVTDVEKRRRSAVRVKLAKDAEQCFNRGMAMAIKQIDNEMLTRLHNKETLTAFRVE